MERCAFLQVTQLPLMMVLHLGPYSVALWVWLEPLLVLMIMMRLLLMVLLMVLVLFVL